MATPNAYVPSRALLRALSRPLPTRCPLASPLGTHFVRGKRDKAPKAGKTPRERAFLKEVRAVQERIAAQQAETDDGTWEKSLDKIPSDEQLEAPGIPVMNWYEKDIHTNAPERLIRRVATPDDRKADRDIMLMMEESFRNPDYDDTELRRRMLDRELENPNNAPYRDALLKMRADVKTKAEEAIADEQDKNEWGVMAARDYIQTFLDEPAAAVARNDLQEALDKMPEDIDEVLEKWELMKLPGCTEGTEFQNALARGLAKLYNDPTFQEKIATIEADGSLVKEAKEAEEDERRLKEALNRDIEYWDIDITDRELVKQRNKTMMEDMRSLLKGMGADEELQAELDAMVGDGPKVDQVVQTERVEELEELTKQLLQLAQNTAQQKVPEARAGAEAGAGLETGLQTRPQAGPETEAKVEEEEEDVPAELQAKVDKIMADPNLIEKLTYIQKVLQANNSSPVNNSSPPDITNIAHEVAPDPYEMDDDRTATLAQRMHMARSDPEHKAALDSLRVVLPPPFGISPALKSFNQAIQFAYIGANDDIRRVLWRSYQKARSLPTFLQNIGDDAWDILYYSQAVTWGSNQNRQDHLRTVLADLRKIGRDGPPTHPSSLAGGEEGGT
jgi:hypothetical protein